MKTAAIICLFLSIACFIIIAFILKDDLYTEDDTKEKCDAELVKDMENQTALEGKSCHAWDDNGKMCRKGKFTKKGNSMECVAAGDRRPLILLFIGVFLLVLSLCLFLKKESSADMSMQNM